MSRKHNIGGLPSPVASSTTKPILICLAIAAALITTCALGRAQSSSAKMIEDLPAGAMQQKTTTACTECHEARIILQQRLSKVAWTKEVDKMIRWGAVVDSTDRDGIIDYLNTSFGVDQPAYTPVRTASEKNSNGKRQ